MTIVLSPGEQADDSGSDRLRVVVVYKHTMGSDQFWNRTSTTNYYGRSATHGFGDSHAESLGITDLDVDSGLLQPIEYLGILNAAHKNHVFLDSQIGHESAETRISVAFLPDDDKRLMGAACKDQGHGTKKDFSALNADDMIIEVEHGSDMRPGVVQGLKFAGIDTVRDDNRTARAQFTDVLEHEAGHDQDYGCEAKAQARSRPLVPGSREIAARTTGKRIAIKHCIVAARNNDDGLTGEPSLNEGKNTSAGPPGEVEITAPRDFLEGSGNGHIEAQIMENANILKGILLFLKLRLALVGEETGCFRCRHSGERRTSNARIRRRLPQVGGCSVLAQCTAPSGSLKSSAIAEDSAHLERRL